MPISNFDFPGVTLEQVFTQNMDSPTPALGTCVIGHRDLCHPASTVLGTYNGWRTTGDASPSEVTLSNAIATGNVITDPDKIKVTFAGTSIKGILPATTVPTGDWALKAGTEKQYDVTVGGTVKPGGEEGVNVLGTIGTAGITRGCMVRVVGTGEDSGKWYDAPVTSVVEAPLPDDSDTTATCKFTIDMSGADFTPDTSGSLVFHRILEREDYFVEKDFGTGYTIDVAGAYPVLGIPAGIATPSSSLTAGGSAIDATLEGANVMVKYYEGTEDRIGSVLMFTSVADIKGELGVPCKDNPEAAAVFSALVESANSVTYYTRAADESAIAYQDAMEVLENNNSIYNIVPATADAAIADACTALAESQSANKESRCRRVVWYGVPATEAFKAASNYSARASLAIAQKKEKTNFYSYRLRWVWCNGLISFNGEDVTDYPFIAAAAAAGLRSGEDPWRPLSQIPLSTVDVSAGQIGATGPMPISYLRALGAEGFWLLSKNRNGETITMKQMTAAASNNINIDEDSIVANADEVCLGIVNVGDNLVGRTNINSTTLSLIEDTIYTRLTMRTANARNDLVGPQLTGFTIRRVYQDPVARDHVYADVDIYPPKPFNKLSMTVAVI